MPHTQGRMFVSEEVEPRRSIPDFYLEVEGYGTVAEIGGGDLETRRANAEHIAGCWNACNLLDSRELMKLLKRHDRLLAAARTAASMPGKDWLEAQLMLANVITEIEKE